MMRVFSLLLFLSTTVCAFAQEAVRPLFPSDFTPSPCAPASSCVSFPDSEAESAAYKFYGLQLDMKWVTAHAAEVRDAVAPLCRKHATCLAQTQNSSMFCDDILSAEARPICEARFPKSKNAHDWEQCKAYLETYLLGIDQNAIRIWETAQACAKKEPPVTHTKQLEVWMVPATIPYEYKGYVSFNAIDPDTHVPILAHVAFEDQIIYAEANPAGDSATYYPFKVPFKSIRVPNKEGHTDGLPPMVTVTAPGYPPTTFRLSAIVPKAIVEMKPVKLHPGTNHVTVLAHDSITGKPVDGRVMLGDGEAGYTNQPITIELPKNGKHDELWLRPYLNRYSDVVLVPAKK
jgi:hypothetical protein